MDDLAEIRQKKLEALMHQQQLRQDEAGQEQAKLQQQVAALEAMLKQKLTRKALERYGNIKLAHPDKAMQLLAIMGSAIESEGLEVIDDTQLKDILSRMDAKRETKITIR
jgi:DNA-binding TFAR19-related protein (PDSD5 family)